MRSRTSEVPWPAGEPLRVVCTAHRFVGGYFRMGGDDDEASEPRHAAPDRSCQCGVYAYREGGQLPVPPLEIIGTCELSGTVIEHDGGFRAERAYPKELWVRADGAVDGDERASRIAAVLERLYGVPAGVLGYDFVDDELARTLQNVPTPLGLARVARIAWTARERMEEGDRPGALGVVLSELRRRDLRELDPGHHMGQQLPAPFFLHGTERRRWVTSVEGEPGEQVLSITSLQGQAPMYYGPQFVDLDTRTVTIVERLEGCVGPRHRGHGRCPTGQGDKELTIARIGITLQLETWIQVLYWVSDPSVLEHIAALRRNRG